jgi:hypothetical protein
MKIDVAASFEILVPMYAITQVGLMLWHRQTKQPHFAIPYFLLHIQCSIQCPGIL